VATRIVNEVKGVNRVVYDVTEAAGDDRVGVRGYSGGLSAMVGSGPAGFREALVGTDIWRMDGLRQYSCSGTAFRRFQEIRYRVSGWPASFVLGV